MSLAETPAEAGHNNPPTPFEEVEKKIDDLCDEARNFADGEPVATEGQAKAVSALIDGLRKVRTEADSARKEENKPFDAGKKAVQDKYNTLIGETKSVTGKVPLALELCNIALKPWLLKLEAEQAERERIAREQAEQAEREAQEALAKRTDSLEDAEQAEAALQHAKAAEATHKATTKERANVKGGARAVGLKTGYYPEMTDASQAMKHYWKDRREDLEEVILTFAQQDVRAGKSPIPGFVIREKKSVA